MPSSTLAGQVAVVTGASRGIGRQVALHLAGRGAAVAAVARASAALGAGARWSHTGLVFATRLGTPIEPRNLNRSLDAMITRAGVRRIRLHDLRHTCATLLLAQGVPARVIMETLGHSQIAVTMNTYAHVLPAMQRDAADQMDAALAQRDTEVR